MIPAILARAERQYRNQIAIREGVHTTSYAEFADRVARSARVLREMAGGPGERVAYLGSNTQSFLEMYFAAARAGLILVPLNYRLNASGLVRLLDFVHCRVLLHDSAHAPLAEECASAANSLTTEFFESFAQNGFETRIARALPLPVHPGEPSDVAQLYFTSGSTGDPKGVMLTHRNVCSHAVMALSALQMSDRDEWGHIAPMFHLADAWACFAATWTGAVHRLVPRFQVDRVLDELATGITMTNLVPTMLGDLVHAPLAQGRRYTLRRVLSGGAPIAPALVDKVVATFACEYVQTYGLTETSPFLTMSFVPGRPACDASEARRLRDRTGRALIGVDLRVVGPDGQDVPLDDRAVGEVIVRGDSVTPGYWQDARTTAAAIQDGWFHTGDLAVLDSTGSIRIVDRKKDVIKTGGETVYSTEVEAVVAAHPRVKEAAAFGIPHPRWGEAVVVAVVPLPDGGAPLEEAELLAWCRERLGGPLRPRRVFFRHDLPRTGSNKIAKKVLRVDHGTAFGADAT